MVLNAMCYFFLRHGVFSFPVTLTPHDCRDIKWQSHRDYGIGDVHVLLTLNECMYLNVKIQTNFRPQICCLSSAMFALNQKFLRLSYFEKIGRTGWMDKTDGQKDGVQYLMQPSREGRVIIVQ